MLYLSPPTASPKVHEAMTAGLIGCMTTPAQGNRVPDGALYACDNGKYGKGWPGGAKWFAWLTKTVSTYGADRCLWATAPDVPFDAVATLAESTPWLAKIRALGVPVAYCAQDGSEAPGLIPWNEIDVLFIAGGDAWKLGLHAADLAREARERGLKVHVGRVNSEVRVRHSIAIGGDYADGTYIRFAPDLNLGKCLGWFGRLPSRQPPHVQFPLIDLPVGGAA